MLRVVRLIVMAAAAVAVIPSTGRADPWIGPGDVLLRHDLTLLADRGVLRGPVTSWPLSWPDISRDVLAVSQLEHLDPASLEALARVRREVRRAMNAGFADRHTTAAMAREPVTLRTFAGEPREEGEAGFDLGWTGERIAWRAQVTGFVDPDDGKHVRFDGSYLGMNIGNFMVSAGFMERWWGPGWEGSLILSSSARPIPSLAIERNYSDAFQVPVLKWLGPWRASIFFGQLEGDRADFADARVFGARVSFKPVQQLEIALSRTAQWCGEGRPCGSDTFLDLLVGADNDQALAEQPGNQLAGYDVRWGFKSVPLALYGQMIGEDEAGGLPGRFLGLFGAEIWGATSFGTWRAHAEYADTSCNFSRAQPLFNCAYESSIYTDGYRFRGRSIGHAMDGDGRMYGLGLLLVSRSDDQWTILARHIDINRDASEIDPRHSLTPLATRLWNLELTHVREVAIGELQVGIGYDDFKERREAGNDSVFRGFVRLRRRF